MFHQRTIRTQLVLLLVVVATLPASIIGAIAYRGQRALAFASAENTVQMAARSRRQTLVHHLVRNRARNTHFVTHAALACHESADLGTCLRPLLEAFAEGEGATAAVLTAPGLAPLAFGAPRGPMAVELAPGQIGAFRGGGTDAVAYVTDGASGAFRVLVERKIENLQDIFDDRFGLGESGETFLVDAKGYFLTHARYAAASGHSHPIDARPMKRCLAGESATMVAGDYRPVEVVHSFQHLPEIGGGCIMAHVDYAEASAPVVALRNRAVAVALAFAGIAVLLAVGLAWLLAKPLRALAGYAGAIEVGDFDRSPPSVRGARELTALAKALGAMARGLKSTLLIEKERAAREEAEHGERRMRLLAETSEVLATSLDCERELGRVAQLVTAAMDARCIVLLRDRDGALRAVLPADAAAPAPELERIVVDACAQGAEICAVGPSHEPVVCLALASARHELGALAFVRSGRDAGAFTETERELMRELARRIVMAIDNARLYRDVQEAVAIRDGFISVASHEIRTPLTTLRLQLSLMQGKRAELPEGMNRSLDSIDRQVTRLDTLIEHLLDVSRITSGRLSLDLAEVDLSVVVREACARFRDALAHADCALTLHADTSVTGRWDALRLDQIVTNLLSNAIKYGAGAAIEVRVEADAREARLAVTDHGIGIAEEDRARIFERFGRAVSVQRYVGLGLGLWIIKEIVVALGGRIDVESELGRGSTFTVHLPLGG